MVFSLNRSTLAQSHFVLYARRADGTDGHEIAIEHAGAIPSGSADGSALLFADENFEHLFVHRFVDHTTQRFDAHSPTHASLSPDGAHVVFGDGLSLFVIDVTSGTRRTLIAGSPTPGAAVVKPVFVGDRTVLFAGIAALRSIDLDGTGMRTLVSTSEGVELPIPALSPDGTRVAMITSCGGETPTLRIYRVAELPADCSAGTTIVEIGQRFTFDDIAWGPDGLIAYSLDSDILVVEERSGAQTNMTADLRVGDVSAALYPTWLPGCVDVP